MSEFESEWLKDKPRPWRRMRVGERDSKQSVFYKIQDNIRENVERIIER